ncbi:hypothetical protein L6164_017220 [Bauhinia variegata]|uniref:Uncharacterized protein n=1 Tax=Bauhinia variegata TaxID=167791 RepID=A0ACB9N8D0_BAUVA|nr:hypothetical protein L6164_017220 [Bauhinia variegata]
MEHDCGSSSSKSPETIEETDVNMEQKISVLVVEDDNVIRLMHKLMLERLNVEVTAVANGKAAVDLYHAGSYFDVIFMDSEMPIMDGAQATKELRAMGVKSMIVGTTSHADDVSERNKFMASAVKGNIPQPLIQTWEYDTQVLHFLIKIHQELSRFITATSGFCLQRQNSVAVICSCLETSAAHLCSSHQIKPREFSANISKPRISALIVNDDAGTRLTHIRILENYNMEAKTGANGKEAVDLYQAGAYFDVILMDQEMPIIDGAGATKELRASV